MTKDSLHSAFAKTGVNRNIKTHENLILGSRIRSQLDSPSTNCPIGILRNQSISN